MSELNFLADMKGVLIHETLQDTLIKETAKLSDIRFIITHEDISSVMFILTGKDISHIEFRASLLQLQCHAAVAAIGVADALKGMGEALKGMEDVIKEANTEMLKSCAEIGIPINTISKNGKDKNREKRNSRHQKYFYHNRNK